MMHGSHNVKQIIYCNFTCLREFGLKLYVGVYNNVDIFPENCYGVQTIEVHPLLFTQQEFAAVDFICHLYKRKLSNSVAW